MINKIKPGLNSIYHTLSSSISFDQYQDRSLHPEHSFFFFENPEHMLSKQMRKKWKEENEEKFPKPQTAVPLKKMHIGPSVGLTVYNALI